VDIVWRHIDPLDGMRAIVHILASPDARGLTYDREADLRVAEYTV
jgi:hypothetical protein